MVQRKCYTTEPPLDWGACGVDFNNDFILIGGRHSILLCRWLALQYTYKTGNNIALAWLSKINTHRKVCCFSAWKYLPSHDISTIVLARPYQGQSVTMWAILHFHQAFFALLADEKLCGCLKGLNSKIHRLQTHKRKKSILYTLWFIEGQEKLAGFKSNIFLY